MALNAKEDIKEKPELGIAHFHLTNKLQTTSSLLLLCEQFYSVSGIKCKQLQGVSSSVHFSYLSPGQKRAAEVCTQMH